MIDFCLECAALKSPPNITVVINPISKTQKESRCQPIILVSPAHSMHVFQSLQPPRSSFSSSSAATFCNSRRAESNIALTVNGTVPALYLSLSGYPSPQSRRRDCPVHFPGLSMISGRHLPVGRHRHPVVDGEWPLSSHRPPPTNCRRRRKTGGADGGASGTPHKTTTLAIPDVRSRCNISMACDPAPRPTGTGWTRPSESDSFEQRGCGDLGRALSQTCLRDKVVLVV